MRSLRTAGRALAFALGLWLGAAASPGAAQDAATLVADRVAVSGDDAISAEGNVVILYGSTRLTARQVRYDRAGDRLTIEGPITLTDGEGVAIVADAADLDADLQNGILRGARLVLEQQLQLASSRIDRVDGRYTQLSNAVASSCQVCPSNPVPLWEVRARKVIHDQQERQIYFEGAQVRVAGVPIAYVPRLRMPDPTLQRATGFLFPELRSSSLLGTGLRVPYFVALGDHADALLTPYISEVTSTLEGRYRQEFSFGAIELNGAASRDKFTDGTRAYLFADGTIYLTSDFRLKFDLRLVSDPSYLADYDYSGRDRLTSFVTVARTTRTSNFATSFDAFRTLRGSELANKNRITNRYATLNYTRNLPTGGLGGLARLSFDAAAFTRPSNEDVLGRDVARAGATLDWQRGWVIGPGIVATAEAGIIAEAYAIDQDTTHDDAVTRVTPQAALSLAWPLSRTEGNGVRHLVEPTLQLAWSDTRGGDVPNEDATLPEFDEGNLFAFSRFPGADRREDGLRANIGIGYTRFDPEGWSMGMTVGKILRIDAPDQFTGGSGLTGTASDWLIAAQYRGAERLSLTTRSLLDDNFDVTRSETRLAWRGKRATVASSYTYADPAPAENRDEPTSEWILDAEYQISRNWTGKVDWRYDTDEGQAARAGLGLRYQTECIGLDLSLSRRFTSSATVLPTTNFSFRVSFDGFGTGRDARAYRRSCSG